MELNASEQESIGLCICLEAIDDLVNHELLDVSGISELPIDTKLYFKTSVHRSLFLIRFLDFAKEGGNSELTGVQGSCLDVLKSACSSKVFSQDGCIDDLSSSVQELEAWLEYKRPIKVWLPTLDIEANLEVSRFEYLKVSGNQSKHNVSRLTGICKRFHSILKDHNYDVPIELIPLALEDLQGHFEENYFTYYGTWISELLNNIRWGLQKYLEPTYRSCYRVTNDICSYKYEYPDNIENEIARLWFWRLMNNIRSGPCIQKFSGSYDLRGPSSLEMFN